MTPECFEAVCARCPKSSQCLVRSITRDDAQVARVPGNERLNIADCMYAADASCTIGCCEHMLSLLLLCRNTYSALNALAGHYNSFGATAPIPKKRLDRLTKVMPQQHCYPHKMMVLLGFSVWGRGSRLVQTNLYSIVVCQHDQSHASQVLQPYAGTFYYLRADKTHPVGGAVGQGGQYMSQGGVAAENRGEQQLAGHRQPPTRCCSAVADDQHSLRCTCCIAVPAKLQTTEPSLANRILLRETPACL